MEIKSPSRPFEKLNKGVKFKMDNYELYHYGIMGMKWGVRRYQNPDGTLTPAGKRRLARREKKEARKIHPSDDYKRVSNIRKKHISELTNRELQDLNQRLSLEKNYRDLNKKKNKGKAAVDIFIKTAGTLAAIDGAIITYQKIGKKVIPKIIEKTS